MNNEIRQIIRNSYDLHYHIGPEIIPRKFDNLLVLDNYEKNNIAGIALKNHFYSTVPLIKQYKEKTKIDYIGSLVLNNFVGGLNSEAIYASSLISDKPIIVWFPTVNAKNFLNNSVSEIPSEWINNKNFITRNTSKIKPVRLTYKEVVDVLQMIKKTNSILATGHISAKESIKLVNKALNIGVKKVIITHPIYQKINMSVDDQIYLAKKGCYIESCYSMYSIDKIPIDKIAFQIKKVGPDRIILSSDVGQKFSPNPSRALYLFSNLLLKKGVSLDMLKTMLVYNPKKILS